MKQIKSIYLLVIIVSLLLSSCSISKRIQQEYIHDTIVNTVYKDKIIFDSIYKYDSIYVYTKGDTVFITKDKYLYKYNYIHDTINTTDTIIKYVTKTEEKIVEKKNWYIRIIVFIALILFIYFIGLKIKKLFI